MSDHIDHLIAEHLQGVDAVIVLHEPGQLDDSFMAGYRLVKTETCGGKRIRTYEVIDDEAHKA